MSRFAAILSGGVGERFWPASTPQRPKQLLPLLGRRTMLRETLERLGPMFPPERTLVVTSAALAAAVAAECPELPAANVVAEPLPRNTGPAAGVAAWAALALGGEDAVVALLPSDHAIGDAVAFRAALADAFRLAEAGSYVVTLGVRPDRPETGYGYITVGDPLPVGGHRIAAFHEKPDAARARELVADPLNLWNPGMFIARARTVVEELSTHEPVLAEPLRRFGQAGGLVTTSRGEEAFRALYAEAPSISFDYAVMERTRRGVVLPAEFGWDDVGSWEAMARLLASDPDGNVVRGAGRMAEARDNIVFAEEGRVTIVGASNLLVVRSGEETFVCSRERLPEIRQILRDLNGGGS
ncbi:MAG: mannose-1-phosphate guanylyltransferase [Gemmatimonadota bacterium]